MKRDSTCMEGERGRAFVRAVPPEAAGPRGRRPRRDRAGAAPSGLRRAGLGRRRAGPRGQGAVGAFPFPAFSRLPGRGAGQRSPGLRAGLCNLKKKKKGGISLFCGLIFFCVYILNFLIPPTIWRSFF